MSSLADLELYSRVGFSEEQVLNFVGYYGMSKSNVNPEGSVNPQRFLHTLMEPLLEVFGLEQVIILN